MTDGVKGMTKFVALKSAHAKSVEKNRSVGWSRSCPDGGQCLVLSFPNAVEPAVEVKAAQVAEGF